ncbi:hypothetical protein [Streptomyces sp. NBC_01235]|uniref:hypothetical protein n=1 Tax=Streptomyces sp. NBC_01235 TaxID=2903788 RepID=UPI002E0F3944|nr:hypothetical protein OG289_45450 [Streptomyces sp. NBC_01235]
MGVHRHEGPGENGAPIPRDLPDQQADGGEDPWDVADAESPREPAEDVPDTDEAGTGRQGSPRADSGRSDHPVPDEPSA